MYALLVVEEFRDSADMRERRPRLNVYIWCTKKLCNKTHVTKRIICIIGMPASQAAFNASGNSIDDVKNSPMTQSNLAASVKEMVQPAN